MTRTRYLRSLLVGLVVGLGLLLAGTVARAQTATAYTGTPYTSLAAATASGPGTAYALVPQLYGYTWTLKTAGTVSTATVNLEGSNDNVTWFVLDQALSTDPQWTSGEMRHVANKPVVYLRLNLIAITGGGAITGTITLFHL